MKTLLLVVVLGLAGSTLQAEAPATTSAAEEVPHPVLPENASWAGAMLIAILGGMFATAAVIGPIVRSLTPDETTASAPPVEAHGH